jgi:hypothetical protein
MDVAMLVVVGVLEWNLLDTWDLGLGLFLLLERMLANGEGVKRTLILIVLGIGC